MTEYHPVDDRIELYGATLLPEGLDKRGTPTDDVSIVTETPNNAIAAKLLSRSDGLRQAENSSSRR